MDELDVSEILLTHSVSPEFADSPTIRKLFKAEGIAPTAIQELEGVRHWPYDFVYLISLKDTNVHHSACLDAKVHSTVGLGFYTDDDEDVQSKVDETLDPLCMETFRSVLTAATEDFWSVGVGYIEVVRGASGEVRGIHHMPCTNVWVEVEDNGYDYHYVIRNLDNPLQSSGNDLHAARWGRWAEMVSTGVSENDDKLVRELIALRKDTSRSRFYGWIDYMAAIPVMDLATETQQFQFDRHFNRGVPDLLMNIIGPANIISPAVKKELLAKFQRTLGSGNSHKTIIAHFAGSPDAVQVNVEKLAQENTSETDAYQTDISSYAQQILAAHRVPPVLAGVQIPGKMGAANETTNALLAFQLLCVGPAQKDIRTTLTNTLGKELGLTWKDFRLNTIVGEFGLDQMMNNPGDTMGRMRESVPEAAASGRNLADGVKD